MAGKGKPGSACNAWKGGITIHSEGYRMIHQPSHPRADCKGYVFEHILIVERATGKPLSRKAQVHHFNEDKGNNANTNLVVCQDQAYHRILHVRQAVKAAGGNPDLDKICSRCQTPKRANSFSACRSSWDKLAHRCRSCCSAVQAALKARKRVA